MPTHAIKIWKMPRAGERETKEAARKRQETERNQTANCEYEASVLQLLSSSAATERFVPTFISVDVAHVELHMELLQGFRKISDVFSHQELRCAKDGLPDATVTELMDRLLEMVAGLDRVGVAHCDLSEENVLARRTADGQLQLKMVDFGLSTTEEQEESSGRGFWPGVQNMDMHHVAQLVWQLATGLDYGSMTETSLVKRFPEMAKAEYSQYFGEEELPLLLPGRYDKDTRELVRRLHQFHTVSFYFHAPDQDDSEQMKSEVRELESMELTPMNVLRVWRRRKEMGGIVFNEDKRVAQQAQQARLGQPLRAAKPTQRAPDGQQAKQEGSNSDDEDVNDEGDEGADDDGDDADNAPKKRTRADDAKAVLITTVGGKEGTGAAVRTRKRTRLNDDKKAQKSGKKARQ